MLWCYCGKIFSWVKIWIGLFTFSKVNIVPLWGSNRDMWKHGIVTILKGALLLFWMEIVMLNVLLYVKNQGKANPGAYHYLKCHTGSQDIKWIRAKANNEITNFGHFSLVAQSYPTLWDPINCRTPGLPFHHQLPELIQTHVHWVDCAIQPSHPLSFPSPLAFYLS